MVDFKHWTKEDFANVPLAKWDDPIGEFNDVVIIPNEYMHDSGFRCMEFVLGCEDGSVVKVGGGSDVVHIEGIGGFGSYGANYPQTTRESKAWSIDCLPCGYLRMWCNGYKLTTSTFRLSDFDVYAETRIDR